MKAQKASTLNFDNKRPMPSTSTATGAAATTAGGGGQSGRSGSGGPSPSPPPPSLTNTNNPRPTKVARRSSGGSGSVAGETGGTGKSSKGLRDYSMKVCKKVEEKGTTSYNEVADELVAQVLLEKQLEFPSKSCQPTDEKNIRRRVYDALNVLMALDVITKDKKEISWNGLPNLDSTTGQTTSSTYMSNMENLNYEIQQRTNSIKRKRQSLKELLVQQIGFRNLVERNTNSRTNRDVRENQKKPPKVPPSHIRRQASSGASGSNKQQRSSTPTSPSSTSTTTDNKIPLPFIIVNTNSNAIIQCNMSRDLQDVMFDFTMPFEINDDNTILQKLGLHRTTMGVLREMLPEDMLHYCLRHHLLDEVLPSEQGQDNRLSNIIPPSLAATTNTTTTTRAQAATATAITTGL